MTKKHWVWLAIGLGVGSQVPGMLFKGSSTLQATAKPSTAKYVTMSPEEHRRATETEAPSKPESEEARVKMEDLPPMDGADKMIGAVVNLNGYLCARPILVRPTEYENVYGVRCITRRDGTGISDYIVNSRTQEVTKI